MPTCIQQEYFQIRFKIFKAEKLPVMDKKLIGKGGIDAFVELTYHGNKLQTGVITSKEGEIIDFNQEFLVKMFAYTSYRSHARCR